MRSHQEPSDPEAGNRLRWSPRPGYALAITALQLLAAFAVVLLFLIPAGNATADGPDDWAGFEYVVYGLLAAPVAAIAAGLIAAARMRLPLFGLYAVPVPLAVSVGAAIARFGSSDGEMQIGVLTFIAGNLLIAFATASLPRRPRKPRMSDRGVPF